jgi:Uma2 family endonuclease
MTLAESALRIDHDNYHRLQLGELRTELIDGRVIEMSPIGSAHRLVVTRLQRQLSLFNIAGRLLVQQPIQLGPFDEPQPDLVVLHHELGTDGVTADDIELLFEVSDTTVDRDRGEKIPRYLAAGVPTIVLFDISDHRAPRVELYTARDAGEFPVRPGGRLALNRLGAEAVVLDFDELFADLDRLP